MHFSKVNKYRHNIDQQFWTSTRVNKQGTRDTSQKAVFRGVPPVSYTGTTDTCCHIRSEGMIAHSRKQTEKTLKTSDADVLYAFRSPLFRILAFRAAHTILSQNSNVATSQVYNHGYLRNDSVRVPFWRFMDLLFLRQKKKLHNKVFHNSFMNSCLPVETQFFFKNCVIGNAVISLTTLFTWDDWDIWWLC